MGDLEESKRRSQKNQKWYAIPLWTEPIFSSGTSIYIYPPLPHLHQCQLPRCNGRLRQLAELWGTLAAVRGGERGGRRRGSSREGAARGGEGAARGGGGARPTLSSPSTAFYALAPRRLRRPSRQFGRASLVFLGSARVPPKEIGIRCM